jgi:CHAD domain-containing protein
MDDAVRAAGGTPGGVSSKLDVRIYPGDRAHRAVAAVLEDLRATIEANLPGTLADVDTEFLHDLRVAVRRTRSIQRQLADVFPAEPLAHFRGEFRWLQQVTGATRDLDVNLLDFDELRATLPPAQRPDLAPLHEVLATRRRDEQRRMARALRSARATALLVAWAVLLEDLSRQELGGPCSALPIAQVAGARIARVHRRMVRAGCAIDDATPAEALHDLRKTGKELRYLLELFAAAYPPEVITQMVRTLKALQDALGRFQDRQVQADRLRALRDDVGACEGGSAALMAMGLLVERLAGEQAAARSEFADRFAAFADPRQRRLVAETFR